VDHIETVKPARRYESLAYLLLLLTFGLLGLIFGVWQVLIPDLTRALRLTPGTLGLALSIGLAASLPAMVVGGRVTDRVGAQRVIVASGIILGLAFGSIALIDRYGMFIAILLVFYASTGIYDVGINAAAMAYEGATGRRVMSYMHAAYSGGGAAGAILAGVLVAAGAPFRGIYVGIAAVAGALVIACALGGLPSSDSRTAGVSTTPSNLYRNRAIMLVAIIVALAFLAEAAITNWSALYLRTALALPALLGSSSVAIAHIAMVVGRLTSAQVVARWGRRRTILAAGAFAASGMALALATTNIVLILLGFLIAGLTIAAVAPVAFSLAGDLAPGQTGQASAVITTLGYAGLLVGPSLIGGLAELAGLRVGLTAVIAVALIIAALSLRVPKVDRGPWTIDHG
jgi:MFS family permease